MHVKNDTPFPIEAWSSNMQSAMRDICETGKLTLKSHQGASAEAAEIAKNWRLAERLEEEKEALEHITKSIKNIFEAIEATRKMMHEDAIAHDVLHSAMRDCAATIDQNLRGTEDAFLTVRHTALDLLRWTRRSGHLEESDLPARYRASYANLISFTPEIKPRLERMQNELLQLRTEEGIHPDVQSLVSALARYRAAADSARGFVKSVVAPPLELVFHDTETFFADWDALEVERRSHAATEFNDCCQFLLYDLVAFEQRVWNIRPKLADGMEASLFVFPVDDLRVLFTVDEDPVFQELIVTLLRIVEVNDYDAAAESVVDLLYRELTGGTDDHDDDSHHGQRMV